MSRRKVATTATYSLLLATLLAAAVNIATSVLPEAWKGYTWTAIPAILLLVVTIALTGSQSTDQGTTDEYLRVLSRELLTDTWERAIDDHRARPLEVPGPIVISWTATDRFGPRLENFGWNPRRTVNGRNKRATKIPTVGTILSIDDLFLRIPARQLIVLGPPGSGKTATAIVLFEGLCRRFEEACTVPYLTSLAEWDPTVVDFRSWLSDRLVRDYPGLKNKGKYGKDVARKLITHGLITPFLDGLDEMPEQLQSAAIRELKRATANGQPFVLTSRTESFARTAEREATVLPAAYVIELRAVQPGDAIRYINDRLRTIDHRWLPVFDDLRKSSSELSEALSKPLMIWLAFVHYQDPATNPRDLLDKRRFATASAIANYLLSQHLRSVYPMADDDRRPPRSRYSFEEADRWLRYLARHIERRGGRDLAWFHLAGDLPRRVRFAAGVLLCMVFGLLGGLAFGATKAVAFVTMLTLVTAVTIGTAFAHADLPTSPMHLSWRIFTDPWPTLRRAILGLAAGGAVGIAMLPLFGTRFAVSVLSLGALLGVGFTFVGRPYPLRESSPRRQLAIDGYAGLGITGLGMVIGALGAMSTISTATTTPTWVAGGLTGILAGGFAGGHINRSANEVHNRLLAVTARSAAGLVGGALLAGSVGVVVGVLLPGPILEGPSTVSTGALFGLFFGTVGAFAWNASVWYRLMLAWAGIRRRLPFNLMDFLADAEDRGVLRRVGSVYQFRHISLQYMLARTPQPDRLP
ncbi:hypothetical protein [Micromonospora sp. WMMD736]|uniref:hypothetical protein n=2 Tax=Micromonospora sp. WMMD736 TaxID=3404112 RepID=UPI003B946358